VDCQCPGTPNELRLISGVRKAFPWGTPDSREPQHDVQGHVL